MDNFSDLCNFRWIKFLDGIIILSVEGPNAGGVKVLVDEFKSFKPIDLIKGVVVHEVMSS